MSNIDEIRNFITQQMQRAANGEITPAMANASSNLAGKLLATHKLEMDYQRYRGEVPKSELFSEITRAPQLEHKKKHKANLLTGEVYQ